MNVRVGGKYHLEFEPDAIAFFGTYLEVTPHSREWDRGVRSVSMVRLCALVLLLAFAGSLSAQEPVAPRSLPTVLLLYPAPDGSVFDRNCADTLKAGGDMNHRSVEEAVRRAPEFQRRWDTEGPTYLATAFKAIGRPFPYAEVQAALTVCPIASMSLPLIINVRGFLTSDGNRQPDWFFPFLVFHELMHTYTRTVNVSSALQAKYSSESALTLNHLHVLALEKFVLTALGKIDELRWLDRDYRTEASPGYRRAWQIVNDTEGVEPFLMELRTR